MIHVISLGAGVQSSTMALMAAHGEITPRPDSAIFADTQGEPKAVYEWLDWLEPKLPFPVHRVTAGNLWASASTLRRTRDGERTYISTGIPVYTVEGLRKGMGRRQCTRTFKIEPINRQVKKILGLKRIPMDSSVLAEMWIGISTDEADRMKPSHQSWLRSTWPLIDAGMSRDDCIAWMLAKGYPVPPRSACTYCPFHDDAEWLRLKPVEFADAVSKERQLQAAYAESTALRSVPYFHAARIPLGEVKLDAEAKSTQVSMFRNECEGMCGV